jgi:pimeloyl-ACP methyl ester carboxylesterase
MMMTLMAAGISAANPGVAGTEQAVEIAGPAGPLAGTFRSGGPGAPVVIIIPGSGPTDRDGNNPLGVKAAPYRLLAEKLSALGVATLRVDKRGMFGSKAAIADPAKVTFADYAADARAWGAKARALSGAKCAWVGGHSEGALVALVAGQQPAGLCGVVSISGTGRPIGAVLREQLRANPANAPILDAAMASIETLEKGGSVDATKLPAPLLALFHPSVQPFIRDWMAHDPAQLAKALKVPLLIVQGGHDLQVGVGDAQALHAAQPKSELKVIAEANHVLKAVPEGDRAANMASYGNPALPLAPGIAEAIASFVKRQ